MMKNKHLGMLGLSLCVVLASCYQTKKSFEGVFTPNCKVFSIGSICFHNTKGKAAKVEIEDIKVEVLPFSTRCFEMYEGNYEYKVKNDGDKWKAAVAIERCKEETIELEKCIDC